MRLDVVIFDSYALVFASFLLWCLEVRLVVRYLALIRVGIFLAQPQGVLRGHNTLQLGPVRSAERAPFSVTFMTRFSRLLYSDTVSVDGTSL